MKSNKKKKKRIGGTIKYLVMILVISAVLAGSGILLSNDLLCPCKAGQRHHSYHSGGCNGGRGIQAAG